MTQASSTTGDIADLLTLRALRTLSAVAQAGSLTRAAVALGLAQSAVSRQVGELERAFGGALFHRTGRGVQPTELARSILPRVEALLAQAEELAHTGRELSGTPSGLVTLGLVPGVSGFLAAALYGVVTQQYPQVRLRVIEGYSGDMETALTQGRIDLAVLNRYRAKGSNSYRRLFDSQLCVVGRRAFLQRALAPKKAGTKSAWPQQTTLQGLSGLPLVLPVPPNAIRNLLDEVAHRHRLALNLVLEGSSSVIVKSMLARHDCASVLPRHAVAEELRTGALAAVPLAERMFRQHVLLATSAQRPFTLASKALAGLIPGVAAAALAQMPAGAEA
ncbi:LysR family transcriptional regulator [Variovorax sp. KK3]|uniref:LysR family transcriptional regulator n=1 Tax=Variovorax sp. KK3 TaxID=1855728 RepID=UPI00097BE734|nr:LysR family transcriptional regulator [Variovorax sp. KK3]